MNKMTGTKAVIMALLAISLISVSSTANATVSKTYKNCVELKKKYPNGVAVNRISGGSMVIDVRPVIYKANKRLDTDRDGIACENEALQQALSTTTTAVTTTTTSTIPTVPIAPSGLTLTVKSPFDGTGLLTWLDNSNNEDNFYISNVDPSKLAGLPLSSIWYKASMNQTSVTITGYSNGYTYCYWAIAANAIGNSTWSTPICSLAGTATTTTTAYVPPSTAYIPPSSGSSSTSYSSYSISGYVGSSYVSLTSSWSSLFQRYSISGYVDSSYVSATSSWSSLSQRYSISGSGTSREAAILAAVIIPPR